MEPIEFLEQIYNESMAVVGSDNINDYLISFDVYGGN